MANKITTVNINATIEISAQSLTAIVEHAKKLAGRDEKGIFRIDTAQAVSRTISRFLQDKDFDSFVEDENNIVLPR